MRKWYEIIDKADKSEIWIYEQIGEDFWTGNGVTAKNFQKELSGIKASQIDLHINSPGGEVFDGITIYNLLKQHQAHVTTYIDGLAASIASVIALAGNKVIMAENALYMIHNPYGMAIGDANVMRKMAESLDKVSNSIALAYKEKTGIDEEVLINMMNDEMWMTAQEALDNGFVDEISEQIDMAACAQFVPVMQKAHFKNIPDDLSGNNKPLTARDIERILRDGGCSEKMAKGILATGFKGEQRDVAPVVEQRDVATPEPSKKDHIADLLTRAEVIAPTKDNKEETNENSLSV